MIKIELNDISLHYCSLCMDCLCNQGWQQRCTQVHFQDELGVEDWECCYHDRVLEENYEVPDVSVVAKVDQGKK